MGGPFRAWAQIAGAYLLPQVVGETSGMRGREPPVIHRVETLDTCVARVSFSCQPLRQPLVGTSKLSFGCSKSEQNPGQLAVSRFARSREPGSAGLKAHPHQQPDTWCRSGNWGCHLWFSRLASRVATRDRASRSDRDSHPGSRRSCKVELSQPSQGSIAWCRLHSVARASRKPAQLSRSQDLPIRAAR
jgi:hypothetical protein